MLFTPVSVIREKCGPVETYCGFPEAALILCHTSEYSASGLCVKLDKAVVRGSLGSLAFVFSPDSPPQRQYAYLKRFVKESYVLSERNMTLAERLTERRIVYTGAAMA